jgi:hypothetical protein
MSFPIELRRYLLTAITASLLIGGAGGFALFAATALTSGTDSLVLVLVAIVFLSFAGFGLFFIPRWYHRAGHIVSSTTPIAAVATFTLETDSDSTSLSAAVSVPHSPTKLRKQIAVLSPKWDRRALLGSSRSVQLFIDPSSSRLVAISTEKGMLWCMPMGQVIPLTSYRP